MSEGSTEITAESPRSGADPSQRRSGVLVPLLGLAVIALLVCGFLMWQRLQHRDDLLDAAHGAEAAGRSAAQHMVTYDYKTLDKDFAWVNADGTNKFAQAFRSSADQVRELAGATKAHSQGQILGSGVHVKDVDHATVLVALNSAITEPDQLSPSVQRWRISINLVRRDGRWLVDELRIL